MWKLFTEIEMPLVFTLFHMEQNGERVEAEELKSYGEELGGNVVKVDNAELVAGLLVVQVGQLGHGLEGRGLRLGAVVKVRRALHAQPLAAVIGGADLEVRVVQKLLVGGLVLAQGNAQVAVVPHGKTDGTHAGQIAIDGGKVEGGILFQKFHDFFIWFHGVNPPAILQCGQRRFDACGGLLGALGIAERRQTEIPLAAGAEALAGGAHNVGVLEQPVKKLPAAHLVGAAQPDVGAVLAAAVPDTGLVQRCRNDSCVGAVVVEVLLDLLHALVGKDGLGTTLDDAAGESFD